MIRTKCEKCGSGVSGNAPCRFCAQVEEQMKEADEVLAVQLERILASGRLDEMLYARGSAFVNACVASMEKSIANKMHISAKTEFKGVND